MNELLRPWKEILLFKEVLRQLVMQQLTLKYRRTVLGYAWTLVNPLLMMSVMAGVFSVLFKVDFKVFAVFLFAGMIPWNFFNSVVTQSSHSFINNEGLIKKIYLPKILFPLSVTLALLIDCLLSFLTFLIIILFLGGKLTAALLILPVCVLLLSLFSMGVALVVSIVTVFFRDLQHVLVIAMQGLFFLSPVLYKSEMMAGKLGWLVIINPIAPFIELFRAPLSDGALPSAATLIHAFVLTVFAVLLGLWVYSRYQRKIVFRL
jgi:ABC-type polysaccharide/polyol phosphate export permease